MDAVRLLPPYAAATGRWALDRRIVPSQTRPPSSGKNKPTSSPRAVVRGRSRSTSGSRCGRTIHSRPRALTIVPGLYRLSMTVSPTRTVTRDVPKRPVAALNRTPGSSRTSEDYGH